MILPTVKQILELAVLLAEQCVDQVGGRIALRRESDRPQVSQLATEAAGYDILNKVLFGGIGPSRLQELGFPMVLTNKWSKNILDGRLPSQYSSVKSWADDCYRVYKDKTIRFDDQGNIVPVRR